MPGVTVERMKEGYSQIRNRALAHAFSYMNLIEGWGTGIPRLIREMKEYGLQEPEFIDMEIALRINLYRNVLDDELNVEAPQSAGEALQSAGKVPEKCRKSAGNLFVPGAAEENCGIYKRKRADSFCGSRRIAGRKAEESKNRTE